jgi:predicted metal-dependent hydrolase
MEITYTLIYSDRKTLGLSVERDKSIVVRAPRRVKENEIVDFIERKKFWLHQKLNHTQKYAFSKKKEFVSGSAILYLGRNYKLNITNEDHDDLKFDNSFIISKKNRSRAHDLFRDWYLQKAREKIIEKATCHAKNLGVEYGEVKVSDLRFRWGSCTPKNNLNFNWRLIKAPLPVVEYVIVHELAHLIEENHTPKFWSIVKTQLPRYREAKDWLKENGNLLEVDF